MDMGPNDMDNNMREHLCLSLTRLVNIRGLFLVFASALSEIQTELQLIVVAHSKWPSLWRVTTVR